jgi:linearmycin/streptolysin S transport system permease protein
MISALIRTSLLNLRRDRSAFVLSFIVPLAFFTIFALVFGNQKRGMPQVSAIVVDEDQSEGSKALVNALKNDASLKIVAEHRERKNAPAVPFDRSKAEAAVRDGDYSVAVIIPKGFGEQPISFGPGSQRSTIELLNDSSDPVSAQVVSGLLQKAAMIGMPATMAQTGMRYFEQASGGLTAQQREYIDKSLKDLRDIQSGAKPSAASKDAATSADAQNGIVAVKVRDVVGQKKANPLISFYAAGIGVMFLLFAASGASGALLDEVESGTLDRVLSTRVTMPVLLAGKLCYLALLGFTQLLVMFVWGALVFKLDLLPHLPGFFVMAIFTSFASAGLGLMLASIARTRAQLGAMSTLVILTMSALGGSMFPRFLMPEFMQKIGLITFNAWALDGFTKVFWRDEPIAHLWPQLLVLGLAAAVFFTLARLFVRKWETS